MQMIDAKIRLWGAGLPSNLSHRQVTHFTPEEAIVLMDEGGVDAAARFRPPQGRTPGSATPQVVHTKCARPSRSVESTSGAWW